MFNVAELKFNTAELIFNVAEHTFNTAEHKLLIGACELYSKVSQPSLAQLIFFSTRIEAPFFATL